MTEKEFDDAMERMGFIKTITTAGFLRYWQHPSGADRTVLEAHYIDVHLRARYIQRIRKSLGRK